MAPKSREQRFQDHTADIRAAQDALGGDDRLVDTPTWQIQIDQARALRRQSERPTQPTGHRVDKDIVFGPAPHIQGPIDSIFRRIKNRNNAPLSVETARPIRRNTRYWRTSG